MLRNLDVYLAEDVTHHQAATLPLYVDLDGTLVHTDVAQELLVAALARPGNWRPISRITPEEITQSPMRFEVTNRTWGARVMRFRLRFRGQVWLSGSATHGERSRT